MAAAGPVFGADQQYLRYNDRIMAKYSKWGRENARVTRS
jgi:hypothetical protein